MKEPDCYQFHAYIIKLNKFTANTPKFVILTNLWMINAKCTFDKNTGNIQFDKQKWRVPISALAKVAIQEKAGKYTVTMYSDLEKQN
eukprot:CAMPEP_0170558246 /NCGR_PEP_ID=MMETSP0211-20121228/33871_1 /TAXON_ID=311385 /ORGANISM="Pseudokeronopsis sp., Strain OXSARD2" /LENGTH=86 /DNA_ID=CAMNT_0010870019 /DNA_START=463 /DNA_END=723 /DNA_ORIENTATION=+